MRSMLGTDGGACSVHDVLEGPHDALQSIADAQNMNTLGLIHLASLLHRMSHDHAGGHVPSDFELDI
jgi:hypothetical protein